MSKKIEQALALIEQGKPAEYVKRDLKITVTETDFMGHIPTVEVKTAVYTCAVELRAAAKFLKALAVSIETRFPDEKAA